jgi:hypothetical protein
VTSYGRRADDEAGVIAWRVPNEGDAAALRNRWRGIAIAAMVFGGLLIVVAPQSLRLPGLIALAVIAAARCWFVIRKSRQERRRRAEGAANVRLDDAGLFWNTADGEWRGISREQIIGFRLGPDALTNRPVSALVLLLAGDWESQPVELHAPATVEGVRIFLAGRWRLPEDRPAGEPLARRLTAAIEAACLAFPPAPEKRVLLRSIAPQEALAQSLDSRDGWRLVGLLPADHTFEFHPESCRFRIQSGAATRIEDSDLEAVLASLRPWAIETCSARLDHLTQALTRRLSEESADELVRAGIDFREALCRFLAGQLLADIEPPIDALDVSLAPMGARSLSIEGSLNDAGGRLGFWGEAALLRQTGEAAGFLDVSRERDEAAAGERMLEAARKLGFLMETIPTRFELRLTASKQRLLAFCEDLRVAAETLERPPFGARPRIIELGHPAAPFPIAYGDVLAFDDGVLWGDPRSLAELAERLRHAVERPVENDVLTLKISRDPRDPWKLTVHVRGEDHQFTTADLFA